MAEYLCGLYIKTLYKRALRTVVKYAPCDELCVNCLEIALCESMLASPTLNSVFVSRCH